MANKSTRETVVKEKMEKFDNAMNTLSNELGVKVLTSVYFTEEQMGGCKVYNVENTLDEAGLIKQVERL